MLANNKRMLLISLALSLAVLGTQAGCGNRQGTNGVKTQNYSDDGFLGQTNANPHIPGRHMALTYKNDGAMIAEAIKNVRGVRSSAVTFNGANAYVRLKLDPKLSAQDASRAEKEAASVLRFNFPRYTIHVTSSK